MDQNNPADPNAQQPDPSAPPQGVPGGASDQPADQGSDQPMGEPSTSNEPMGPVQPEPAPNENPTGGNPTGG